MRIVKFFLLVCISSQAFAEKDFLIEKIEFRGLKVSDLDWITEYLDITVPEHYSALQIIDFKKKVLTTDVFSRVDLKVSEKTLIFDVEEKWTLIPVIRGAFGGGIPLYVVGGYNIHTLGRLWTVGAEMRKYGSAAPGGVIYAKAPRWLDGRYSLGFELWKDFRKRNVYDDALQIKGTLDTEQDYFRTLFLVPSDSQITGHLQFGAQYEYKVSRFARYEARTESSSMLLKSESGAQSHFVGPGFVYDNVQVDQLRLHGIRAQIFSGTLISKELTRAKTESESYGFYAFENTDVDLAGHYFFGSVDSEDVKDIYFLGGLESVRGLPDSSLVGNKAFYYNLELRHILFQSHYLQVQNALFLDEGYAAMSFAELKTARRTTAGFGFRFNVPQVYRLLVRVDYGWGLQQDSGQGFSIGIGQFFHPYKPL